MLVGTLALTTIDTLVAQNCFSSSSIRNAGDVIANLIHFCKVMEEECKHYENGWDIAVVNTCRKHDVAFNKNHSRERAVVDFSDEALDSALCYGADGDGRDDVVACYEPERNEGERRSWVRHDWHKEVSFGSPFFYCFR